MGVWQGTALDLGLLALFKYMSYKFAVTFELNLTVHLASLPALRKMTLFILKVFQNLKLISSRYYKDDQHE